MTMAWASTAVVVPSQAVSFVLLAAATMWRPGSGRVLAPLLAPDAVLGDAGCAERFLDQHVTALGAEVTLTALQECPCPQ